MCQNNGEPSNLKRCRATNIPNLQHAAVKGCSKIVGVKRRKLHIAHSIRVTDKSQHLSFFVLCSFELFVLLFVLFCFFVFFFFFFFCATIVQNHRENRIFVCLYFDFGFARQMCEKVRATESSAQRSVAPNLARRVANVPVLHCSVLRAREQRMAIIWMPRNSIHSALVILDHRQLLLDGLWLQRVPDHHGAVGRSCGRLQHQT